MNANTTFTEDQLRENEQAAEQYYRFLFMAVKQRDWKNMLKDPPENIDWTHLPRDIVDQFDKLRALIGELSRTEGKLEKM